MDGVLFKSFGTRLEGLVSCIFWFGISNFVGGFSIISDMSVRLLSCFYKVYFGALVALV